MKIQSLRILMPVKAEEYYVRPLTRTAPQSPSCLPFHSQPQIRRTDSLQIISPYLNVCALRDVEIIVEAFLIHISHFINLHCSPW